MNAWNPLTAKGTWMTKPETEKPADEKSGTKTPTETKPGEQQDDNIDDMGRPVNDPKGKPVDQPV